MVLMKPKGTIGMALAAFKLWRRLPRAQRKRVIKHGPKAAAAISALLRRRKRR